MTLTCSCGNKVERANPLKNPRCFDCRKIQREEARLRQRARLALKKTMSVEEWGKQSREYLNNNAN